MGAPNFIAIDGDGVTGDPARRGGPYIASMDRPICLACQVGISDLLVPPWPFLAPPTRRAGMGLRYIPIIRREGWPRRRGAQTIGTSARRVVFWGRKWARLTDSESGRTGSRRGLRVSHVWALAPLHRADTDPVL